MLSGRRKLLLADDSPTIQKVISLTFGDEGFEVITVGDGGQALGVLNADAPPDVLLADVHMPGMTGVELHRHLVVTGRAIPTILVTAYPDEVVRDQALKDGVVCYLSKPVDDDDLERCLRSALQPDTPIEDNS